MCNAKKHGGDIGGWLAWKGIRSSTSKERYGYTFIEKEMQD